jgi:hypothetical protein
MEILAETVSGVTSEFGLRDGPVANIGLALFTTQHHETIHR